jgi:hypothetical protein
VFSLIFILTLFVIASDIFAEKDEQSLLAQCECGNGVQEAIPHNLVNPKCPFRLYGTTSVNPQTQSRLYAINTFNGEVTEIGPIAAAGTGMAINRVTSIDFSPEGILYGLGTGTQAPLNNRSILITIDCTTAEATVIGQTGVSLGMGKALTDMSFDQYGQLYAYLKDSISNLAFPADQLGTINVSTGEYSKIGESDFIQQEIGNGLTFGNFPSYPNQILYQAGNFRVSMLDLVTGMAIPQSLLSFSDPANNRPRINGLETDYLTGIIYVSLNDKASGMGSDPENYLGKLDPDTGQFTFIKIPAMRTIDSLDGLAFNRPYEECDVGTPIPAGSLCGGDCYLNESICNNMTDNDFDGLIDCEDEDCPGQACEDGDLCTMGEMCDNGLCLGGLLLNCDDGNACTDDSCDANTGFCLNQGNESNICTDNNQCTQDSCTALGTCQSVNVSNNTQCNDGLDCTSNDICTDGICSGTPGIESPGAGTCGNGVDDDCDGLVDGNDPDCGGEICDDGIDNDGDLLTDCADLPDCPAGTACQDDGNPCTDNTCSLAICVSTNDNSNSCSDGNDCTDDVCNNGVCNSSNDNSNSCSDADLCTIDSCTDGSCNSVPIACDDSNECTNSFCVAGSCQHQPIANNTPCTDDGNVCTDDMCQNGICSHTFNTASCDDGDACSSDDVCNLGQCVGNPGIESCVNSLDDDCDNDIDQFDIDCVPENLRIFLSSTTYQGDLGGFSGADMKCQTRADAAALGGVWIALVSDNNSNAIDRLVNCNNKAWILLSGPPNVVADDKQDLFDETIQQAINVDEFANDVKDGYAWTGTLSNGIAGDTNCENWTQNDNQIFGIRGSAELTKNIPNSWVNFQSSRCHQERHLFCMEIDTNCP